LGTIGNILNSERQKMRISTGRSNWWFLDKTAD